MPVYDFVCPECGHVEEDYMCSVEEGQEKKCAKCEKPTKIKIGPAGTVFGDSFYNGMGVKRFEIIRTDQDGKEHKYDMAKHMNLSNS